MISRYGVFLNNIALNDIHGNLYVADIQYPGAAINNTKTVFAKRQGALLSRRYKERETVVILFLLEIYNTAERQYAVQDVQDWAKNGGVLETSDRPNQILRVICESYPSILSALKWKDTLSITFSAYSLPYWQDKSATTVSVTNNTETARVPGNVAECGAPVDVTATLTASASSLVLGVGSKEITLSGLNFDSGDVVRVYHDDNMFLHITRNGSSILDKRSGADDLAAVCGENNTFKVAGPATAEFSVRGLWH